MTFRVYSAFDAAAWDGFVSSHPCGNFMQSYAWGDFQREMGWQPHYGVLNDGPTIRGAVLLLGRSLPGLGKVFHAPRGPAVDYADTSATDALLEGLTEYLGEQRAAFVRFDPYWTEKQTESREIPTLLRRVPRDWSYWNGPRFVFWLDLSGDEDDVLARLTSRCRNDVRRGYRNEVVFSPGTDEELEDFHRLMALTGAEKGIAFHELGYYRRLLEVVNRSANVQLFVGRFQGQVITAGISVAYGQKAWLLYAASSPEFYKLRANRTQQWEMIKWAHGQGCGRYDFRGTATNDPPSQDDPGYGVYQFKKSFGPEFTRLTGYYDLVKSPTRHRLFRIAEEYTLPAAYRVRTWIQERPLRRQRATS